MYYLRSTALLTRRQVSVLYTLLRVFHCAQIYVVSDHHPPYLFIQFQANEHLLLDEFQWINELLQSSDTSTLLQFVHLYQLLGEIIGFCYLNEFHCFSLFDS